MSELPQLAGIIRVLLQDFAFLQNWNQVGYALELPTSDLYTITSRFRNGNTTMFEIIFWMLKTWHCRKGPEANLTTLIQILKREDLRNAAAQLMEFDKSTALCSQVVKAPSNGINLLNGNLIILEKIDVGAFSEVLKVRSIVCGKYQLYAVKKICVGQFLQLTKTSGAADAFEYFEKLMREVVVMSQLPENPNIVAYQDAWFDGPLQETFTNWLVNPDLMPCPSPVVMDVPPVNKRPIIDEKARNTFMYIKMELLDTNLGHWFQLENQSRDYQVIKEITGQILRGVSLIHSLNYVHRDLHPNNILLNIREDQRIVKVGDFGLSRKMPEVDTALTKQVGCRQFASPEMDRGDTYDFKTDIFSVGLIVLFMLHPFESQRKMESAFDVVRQGELKIVDNIEAKLGKKLPLLRLMLDRKPEKRPSAQEALQYRRE